MLTVELIPASQALAMNRVTSTDGRTDSTVWYEIRVSDPMGTESYIRKRYRDFDELHKKVMLMPGVKGVPAMPKKSFFRKTFIPHGPFMAERQQRLARILESISSQPAAFPVLREFVTSNLDPPAVSKDAAVKSEAEVSTKARIANEIDSTCDTVEIGENEVSTTASMIEPIPCKESATVQVTSQTPEPETTSPVDYVAGVSTASEEDLKVAFVGLSAHNQRRLEQILASMIGPSACKDAPEVKVKSQEPESETTSQAFQRKPEALKKAAAALRKASQTGELASIVKRIERLPEAEVQKATGDALSEVAENGELVSSLSKIESSQTSPEENTIGTPPPSPRTMEKPRSQSMQWLDIGDDPGTYEVRFACDVTEEMTSMSREICELAEGEIVNVLEVVVLEDESRIRGRIESHGGWISLEDTSTGARWAEKHAERQKAPTVKCLIDFEECQREIDATRGSEQRKSKRGPACCKKRSKTD